MLKTVTTWLAIIATATVFLPLLQPAKAQSIFESDEVALVFCAYVRDNQTQRLQRKLRDLRIRLRDIYSHIRCNNATLIQFAVKNRANDIGRFIARSVNLNDLKEVGDYQWMHEQNLLDSPIGETISARFNP
ncbi:hypothetical protein PSI9734_01500 [Pseudidiomarina piscicola]|uniref:DUF3718 domain-containing protein n=1 Tax=Pseudidiomarina piscicola TaxID=2614830 RepID=A0A6S6WMN7_9GAMM|nr:DUF3718 domain-containing protein [Pseudidiomarina piscicola]CAB0151085.1 hypothetical protein PSI9734_01500 [Pseudidiomarina piscicola]VZT40593.1 hypothetical protein PSI9734_01500 [Pseudomonas aeruginosa]